MTHDLGAEWMRTLGSTGLPVSAVTLGGGPLGSQPQLFGYDTPQDQAVDLVQAVVRSPIRTIDTANGYSGGASETRIGLGVAAAAPVPEDFLVITKVDPLDGDYSYQRVRRSVDESRERLGMDVLPMVHLHDPEKFDFAEMSGRGGAIDALVDLKDEGVIGHIGLAGGPTPVMQQYLDVGVFEVLLVHNRWTLVDRSATDIIARASQAGMGIVNAAIYGGGILAKPDAGMTTYAYRPASADTLRAIAQMNQLCSEWGVDLATAALQFSLRDRRIHSTIVGFSKQERLEPLLRAASAVLPEEFWSRLEELVPDPPNWRDYGVGAQ